MKSGILPKKADKKEILSQKKKNKKGSVKPEMNLKFSTYLNFLQLKLPQM